MKYVLLTFISCLLAFLPACTVETSSNRTETTFQEATNESLTIANTSIPTITTKPISTTIQPQTTPLSTGTPTVSSPLANTAVPININDAFFSEMQSKNYQISQSGSLIGLGGYTYSAYIFVEPEAYDSTSGEETNLESWIIAFYAWDGQKNSLIGTFYGTPYTRSYPDSSFPKGYYLMNWDDPVDGRRFAYLDTTRKPDDYPRQALNLSGLASDINNNGLPEFSFVGAYCPISCNQPQEKYDFFEIQNSHTIVDLAANLPDHLSPFLYDANPAIFPVCVNRGYDFYLSVNICTLYTWNGNEFTDVTKYHAEDYIGMAQEKLQKLQADYGTAFDNHDLETLNILMLFEVAGMREQALQTFLETTDASHWPGTTPLFMCWLQISRATIQEDYKNNRQFSMPPNTEEIDADVNRFLILLDSKQYDLSECQSLQP